jgi:hypothetical protein
MSLRPPALTGSGWQRLSTWWSQSELQRQTTRRGCGLGGEESSQLQPPVLPWRTSVRGAEPCCQDPHGLGVFRLAETGGVGGDLSTATTEEEAASASRDLRATFDTSSTATPVPERLSGHNRDGPRSLGRLILLQRTSDQVVGLPRCQLAAVLLCTPRLQPRGTPVHPVTRSRVLVVDPELSWWSSCSCYHPYCYASSSYPMMYHALAWCVVV